MTALEQLGAFVATHHPDHRTQADVRLHVADIVGAWLAASAAEEGSLLRAFVQPGAGLIDRVAVHCALARLSEIDDIHLAAMVTPGAVVVPAALTIAAELPSLEPAELAAAIVAGYEAMVRLGAAIDGPTVLYRGIWPTYFAAPFGVAAAASRLMRLTASQTANALSIALIMAAPGTGHHAAVTTVRWLALGQAAARGVQAALSAGAGFTSDVKIADGDFLANVFGVRPDVSLLANGMGELALSQTSFKPWCAARQTMAATQALAEILAEGVAVDSIARIGVAVLPPHRKMIDHGVHPGDRFSFLTSLPYQMAVAALAPDCAFALTPPREVLPPALAEFMGRIQVRAEDSLLEAGYPQAWAARVTVTTRAKRHEHGVAHVPGDPSRPFSEEALKKKFGRFVTPALADQQNVGALWEAALAALEKPGELLRNMDSEIASPRSQ
jgi:2-methylcitrate dehydratase PrpD